MQEKHDAIDITEAKAIAKNESIKFPKAKSQLWILLRKIATERQKKQGTFEFSQVYDILEETYKEEVSEKIEEVEEMLEEWVENDQLVEKIAEEEMFTFYKIRQEGDQNG